ncbi:MAG: serine protease, partial [Deltaproteobacteria bacterium]|nr:serine protease [Deltaproteobacteria bacterium]
MSACSHRPVDYGGVAVMEGSLRRAQGAEDALQRSAEAVAIIETDVARGMGFVIDPSGYLLTNRHVVEDAEHIEGVVFPARDPSRSYGSVRVVYIDPVRDLALLHVYSSEPLTALPLATDDVEPVSRYLSRSDPVVLMEREAPAEGVDPALQMQHGWVFGLEVQNPAAGPGAFVGVTADVHKGQSGGPVLDRHGRAVGIVTWTWRERGGGYAIPIADATQMLSERPSLEDAAEREQRAALRTQLFLDALQRGEGDLARSFTSPTQARKRREDTVAAIMDSAQRGQGLVLMQQYVTALEGVVAEVQRTEDPGAAESGLGALVSGSAQPEFMAGLGVGPEIDVGQVVSFFHELGERYLRARIFGEKSSEDALRDSLRGLRTMDAARSFALAALVVELQGRPTTLGQV